MLEDACGKVSIIMLLTNGARMPEQLQIVICMADAVVRLPYRGLFEGSQARGSPTTTKRPSEITKMAK